ncbi:MAG: glutathione S-transferase family protein [Alphaproteobacteria bacterium]
MQNLYHAPFDPFSRKVRAYLQEVGLNFNLKDMDIIERPNSFLRINPSGETPVLEFNEGDLHICGHDVICETIEEMLHSETMLGDDEDPRIRAEVRRLTRWFDVSFHEEVTVNLFHEKVINPLSAKGTPNARAIQAGYLNLRRHFSYMEWLLKKQNWLACNKFSLADIAAASQISVIDYTGDVPWSKYETIKEWYMLVKSRPSFQPFWKETVVGRTPSKYYTLLDF